MDPLLAELHAGRLSVVWSLPDGSLRALPVERPRGLLSGSFNPLHEGHIALRDAADRRLSGPVCYELSILNADKPPLDAEEIERRRSQFGGRTLALTRAATFVEKAALFPGTVFVVGIDTAERIVEPRFYDGRDDLMRQAVETIGAAGCRFLVAGRELGDEFRTLDALRLPAGCEGLFEDLPAAEFRIDVSSSERRNSSSE